MRTASCFAALVVADLPVHCPKPLVAGEWVFHLGPLSEKRTSCGHQNPDKADAQPEKSIVNPVAQIKVGLHSPATVKVLERNGTYAAAPVVNQLNKVADAWTMIYDEGFEFNVDGYSFFTFSGFDWVTPPGGGAKTNVSRCDETQVGWYHDQDRTKFGCFYGVKTTKVPPPPIKPKVALLEMSETATRITAEHQHEIVQRINSRSRKSWVAREYPKYNGKTYRELSQMAGIPRTRLPTHRQQRVSMLARCSSKRRNVRKDTVLGNMVLNATEEEVAPCPTSADAAAEDAHLRAVESALPKDFTWGSNHGNWLEPVMDQGDCGSCYAVSTMRMLSARHKIAQNNTSLKPWSITFPLMCNEYNQGCNGGYGFLMSKWSQDVGLVPADCARYSTTGKCQVSCDMAKEGKRFRASQHRYIGGFYGNATVAEMMTEVHARGPVVVSFEPSSDFMYYSGGVFDSGATPMPKEWQQVDHAVLLVGWGEEAGQKYWLVQNSWGTDWGENGYFRIARGGNDSGIESQPEAAEVVEDERDVLSSFLEGRVHLA
mmetsp:Transcript_42522/g.102441  ORF Transcript_42522/g.102441 Transcript_42522/m.102441 type:complete len:543 (-) Transcript_42522:142-1770(-)